jgi:hypothetical protein
MITEAYSGMVGIMPAASPIEITSEQHGELRRIVTANKHPKVITWLKRHPRFHLHLTPTSSSWLNLVERFFGEITRQGNSLGQFSQCRRLGGRHFPLPRSS